MSWTFHTVLQKVGIDSVLIAIIFGININNKYNKSTILNVNNVIDTMFSVKINIRPTEYTKLILK